MFTCLYRNILRCVTVLPEVQISPYLLLFREITASSLMTRNSKLYLESDRKSNVMFLTHVSFVDSAWSWGSFRLGVLGIEINLVNTA